MSDNNAKQTIKNEGLKKDASDYINYLEDKIKRICAATGINPDIIK